MAVNIRQTHLQRHLDPLRYMCTCGACKKFWHAAFKNNSDSRTVLSEQHAESSFSLGDQKPVAIGDRVKVNENAGVVKFVGFVDDNSIAPSLRIGVRLDESVHLGHDGVYNGKRYFHCTNGHGVFVKYTEITPAKPLNKRPPLQGNTMFPSWPEICKRRKQREIMLEEMHEELQKTEVIPAKPFPPPLITPRVTRTQMLRQSAMKFHLHEGLHGGRNKQQQGQRGALLTARMFDRNQTRWEDKQILQWHKKYTDAEKVKRMGDTLKKLIEGYEEGHKLIESTSPEPEVE